MDHENFTKTSNSSEKKEEEADLYQYSHRITANVLMKKYIGITESLKKRGWTLKKATFSLEHLHRGFLFL